MKKIIVMLAAISMAQMVSAASGGGAEFSALYCTGTGYDPLIPGGQATTDALVQISAKAVSIEISTIGRAQASMPLMPLSGVLVGGAMQLEPALQGQGRKEVWVNLNRYSGDFVLMEKGSQKSAIIFSGQCKPAKALF
ncbi:MAG: hypothetical protein ACOY3X_09515 [Pseudomonadota bacterium]